MRETADAEKQTDQDYSGADSFTFKASDGLLESAAATVTINVAAISDARRTIHVAGSKGKGSIAAIADSILEGAAEYGFLDTAPVR